MRKVVSRREMLWDMVAFAGVGMGACIPYASRAATCGGDVSSAEQRYEEAIDLLKRGRWLNLCATKLKDLSATSPQDVRYRIALGYAYASQCVSLCYSLGSPPKTPATNEDVQRYDDAIRTALAAAKAKQEGMPEIPAGESPQMPAKPASGGAFSFVTVDDGKSIVMTQEEFVAALRRGFEDATACWKAAVELAVGDEQKGSCLEAQIWGMQLFQFIARYSASRSLPVSFPQAERGKWREEAIKLAEQLATLSPDNPQYLLLLAEVSLQPYDFKWNNPDESMLTLYEKAMNLGVDDPAVRYRAYQVCLHMKPQNLDKAGLLIREFAANQHGNSYAQYRLAGYIARYEMDGKLPNQNDTEKAREAIKKLVYVVSSGTLLATYKSLGKCISPPTLLGKPFALLGQVWEYAYMDVEVSEGAMVARLLAEYALRTAEKDVFFAKRCCYAILDMGKRLVQPLPADGTMSDADLSEQARELAGEIIVSRGYSALSEILKTRGSESEYNKIVSEQKEFAAYQKQRFVERLKQSLGHR